MKTSWTCSGQGGVGLLFILGDRYKNEGLSYNIIISPDGGGLQNMSYVVIGASEVNMTLEIVRKLWSKCS